MCKFDKVMMESAKLWAKESYCTKGQVGAVLADKGRIVATGYNGTVSGKPNVCEIFDTCLECSNGVIMTVNGAMKCSKCNGSGTRLQTSPYTVHAEQNVIAFCAKTGIATEGLTLYVTLSPCAMCAKLIVQAGISRVVYLKEYKDDGGIAFLKDCGITCEEYK